MTIKNEHGKSYMLSGPNKLTKNSDKFWNYNDIKYVNFSNYGESLELDNSINKITIEKNKDNHIINEEIKDEIKEEINVNSIKKENIKEDDYLDEFDQEFFREEIEEKKQIVEEEYELQGGSPVIYKYITNNNETKERKIFSEIHDNIFIISKNEIIHSNNFIICEWNKSVWMIISIEKTDKYQKLITQKIS